MQELFVPRETAAVVLRWRWQGDAAAPLTSAGAAVFLGPGFSWDASRESGISIHCRKMCPRASAGRLYQGVPAVTARSNGTYHHEPCWYRNFLYEEELARGLDATGGPGRAGPLQLRSGRGSGGADFFRGWTGQSPARIDARRWNWRTDWRRTSRRGGRPLRLRTSARRTPISSGAARARRSSPVTRGLAIGAATRSSPCAGCAWPRAGWRRRATFCSRGPDTVSQGMLPNRFPDQGDVPEYNSVDASLWYVIVVHEFLEAAGEDPALTACRGHCSTRRSRRSSPGYLHGTRYGIRRDADGLLACGAPGSATDLDGREGGRLGGDAAHRQAGRGAGAVAERARR